ncbi:FT-interacting protein 1-like protein [Tanacetum coccineum]
MTSGSSSQPMEYALKETSPFLVVGQYLFVRVVKAQDLPSMDITGTLDSYVELRVGNYTGTTRHVSESLNPEWNTVFAFSKERLQATVLEVVVKDKDMLKDDIVGTVRVNLNDVPTRVPSDIPLAPEWYRIEDEMGTKEEEN